MTDKKEDKCADSVRFVSKELTEEAIKLLSKVFEMNGSTYPISKEGMMHAMCAINTIYIQVMFGSMKKQLSIMSYQDFRDQFLSELFSMIDVNGKITFNFIIKGDFEEIKVKANEEKSINPQDGDEIDEYVAQLMKEWGKS